MGSPTLSALRRRGTRVAGGMVLLLANACFIFTKVSIHDVAARAVGFVSTSVKAHLSDGSTVLFPRGVTISRDGVRGEGFRYGFRSSESAPAGFLAVDSIVGMETYSTDVKVAPTLLVSTAATALTLLAVGSLMVLALGSCPTFYTDSAGVAALEAEGFSYSIAPLFEARDVDRLRAGAGPDGTVRIEVRNEMLETHYLNHLELVEARHAPGDFVLPDHKGAFVAARGLKPALRATDRGGRDVGPALRATDGIVFSTDPKALAAARVDDLEDYVDLTLPVPSGADSVALVFRMRNSLLNTVLLYDGMLGSGAQSLDYVGTGLQQISTAVELGRWYVQRMGMRIAVRSADGTYRTVARLADSGPIAEHDIAAVIPAHAGTPGAGTLQVRLSFAVDDWRIDRVAVSESFGRPPVRTLAVARVSRDDGQADQEARASLGAPDESYLVTSPGQRFGITFDAGAIRSDSARTFLLASQGYYTEWVRGSWLKAAPTGKAFVPSDSTLFEAIQHWRAKRGSFEKRFYATRIPVR